MTRTRLFAVLAAVATATVALLFLSACNSPADTEPSDGHAEHSQAGESPLTAWEPADFNADDVSFATEMIPHHQQAVELSALVPDRSTNPELLTLATQISGAQQPEIDAMKVFLVQWKENSADGAADGAGGHAGHGAMAGMVDDATMARLETLSGPDFETLWLQSMIAHHQGAIEIAKVELANGRNVDAKALAQTMVDAQQAEIALMQKMLGQP